MTEQISNVEQRGNAYTSLSIGEFASIRKEYGLPEAVAITPGIRQRLLAFLHPPAGVLVSTRDWSEDVYILTCKAGEIGVRFDGRTWELIEFTFKDGRRVELLCAAAMVTI